MIKRDEFWNAIQGTAFGTHWEGFDRGELRVQWCPRCKVYQWPPNARCIRCQDEQPIWKSVTGKGSVWSFARYERALQSGLEDWIPYVVAVVALDEGIHYLGRIINPSSALGIGTRVRVQYAKVFDDITAAVFCESPSRSSER